MTTNRPEVVAWYTPPARGTLPVVALNDRSERGEPLIRLSDYDALQAECRILEALEWLRGAINCTPENDKQKCGAWISTKHPRIRQIDELLAAYQKKAAIKEITLSDYIAGMGPTTGMWEMASDCLNSEKLPDSLSAAIYALRSGDAVVMPKAQIEAFDAGRRAAQADSAELAGALKTMIEQAQRVSVCGNFSSDVVLRAIDALAAYRKGGGVMLCEHGNTTPCVECDIEPLKAENESLRRDISALVEALEYALETMENVDGANDCSRGIDAVEEALAAYRKKGGDT